MKFCSGCKTLKHNECFSKRNKNSNSLRSKCKTCLSKAGSEYNKLHKEQAKHNSQKVRERSKIDASLRYSSFKARLKDRVKLSKEQYCQIFSDDPSCIYCGAKIRGIGSGLDRIDNKLDYTVDNVNPCCGTCNDIRGDNLSVEEMKVAMTAVLKLRAL